MKRTPEIGERVFLDSRKGTIALRVDRNAIGGWKVTGTVLATSWESNLVGKKLGPLSRSRLRYSTPTPPPERGDTQ